MHIIVSGLSAWKGCFLLPTGDSRRGGEEGRACAEGGIGSHQPVIVCSPAALSPDPQHDLSGKELDDHLSVADRVLHASPQTQQRRSALRRSPADPPRIPIFHQLKLIGRWPPARHFDTVFRGQVPDTNL